MKIMQINVVYPSGSTGKIVKDIHTRLLDDNHESIVCFGRGEAVADPYVYKIAPEFFLRLQSFRANLTGYAYGGCFYSSLSMFNIIKKEKPDIVHLHCINGYMVNIYKLLEFLKKNNIPTVLTIHAEFMHTAGCGHALECEKWKTGCGNCPQKGKGRPASKIFDRSSQEWNLMNKAFEGFENIVIVSVSQWLHDRAKQSPFFKNKKLKIVLNGTDTDNVFKPTDFLSIKEKYAIENEKIILHVTPDFNNPIKGGQHVLEIARRLENEKIKIIIVGYNGKNFDLPKNVITVKNTKDQRELAAFYSLADLTLLTSVKETFSMICAESLACGTPVVGFEAGGPETISIKEFSQFVPQGDLNQLEHTIRRWLGQKEKTAGEISNKAREVYSKEHMYRKYAEIYRSMII